jgi:hypothetical protein
MHYVGPVKKDLAARWPFAGQARIVVHGHLHFGREHSGSMHNWCALRRSQFPEPYQRWISRVGPPSLIRRLLKAQAFAEEHDGTVDRQRRRRP